jgi:hypothetical protein
MILASNKNNGTYKRLDIEHRVATILNNFKIPSLGGTKHLYSFCKTNKILHLYGIISFTATVRYRRGIIKPCIKGSNSFWETGYVGMVDSIPFYSSKVNA